MRKMKLYTKTGDSGTTGILGKDRVNKDDLRIEAYGTIDELNSALGVAALYCDEEIGLKILNIQLFLFDIGTELAYQEYTPHIVEDDVTLLENYIDESEAKIPELKNFIIPGGSLGAAHLHLARTICRRAERRLVSAKQIMTINTNTLAFLNRLSDLLFSWSRLANFAEGKEEIIWKQRTER
ncbi:MAG: cob(I)yrinic acid a,c-diamide adenosyltransferase [Candidatus Heimdallarchaeota archaeon]|nr:cob(I)yrinic acid a,c-diamide adenosyltransferase [Candidatus Heimdallarchaeota archaeon]